MRRLPAHGEFRPSQELHAVLPRPLHRAARTRRPLPRNRVRQGRGQRASRAERMAGDSHRFLRRGDRRSARHARAVSGDCRAQPAAGRGDRRLEHDHPVGRARAHRRRCRGVACHRAPPLPGRTVADRRPEQSARMALGRRFLRPLSALLGRRSDPAAHRRRIDARGVLGFHVSGVLGDAPRLHAAQARDARRARTRKRRPRRARRATHGKFPSCRECSIAPPRCGCRFTGCSSGFFAAPPRWGTNSSRSPASPVAADVTSPLRRAASIPPAARARRRRSRPCRAAR